MRSSGYWTGAALALLVEFGSLAALAFWGLTVPSGAAVRVLLGIGLPVAAALLWGLFAAPRAVVRITALVAVTKVAVQGGAVAALAVAGQPWLAVVLGLAAAIGRLLTGTLSPPAAGPIRSGPGPRRAGGSPTG